MYRTLSSLVIASVFVCMQQHSLAAAAAGRNIAFPGDTAKETKVYVDALVDRLFASLKFSIQNKANRFRDQLVLIDSVLEMDSSNTSALHLQAQIFANLKEYEKAIAVLSRTIVWHPQLSKLYVFRGALYDIQGKKTSARKDYHKTLELIHRSIDSLAPRNENKLHLTATASIVELLLGSVPQKALSTFDRRVAGEFNSDLTERVRITIERFDKEEFLAGYRRGNL